MVDIKSDKTILNFDRIDETLKNIKDRGFYEGKSFNRSAANTWQEIDDLVQEWKIDDPTKFHTPEGLDALKKAVGDVRDKLEYGTSSRNVADNAYKAIWKEISDQAPTYGKVMSDYEQAASLINEIEKSLSLGKKAQADQSLRKLQSIMRNNALTAYGRRTELGEALQQYGAKDLPAQLAGQSLQSFTPRGLIGQGAATATGLGSLLTGNPLGFLLASATSPRLMGEAAYMAGRVRGAPQSFVRLLNRYGDKLAAKDSAFAMPVDMAKRAMQAGGEIDPYILRQLTAQLGRLEEEEKR
jgi:hypothetical protein